MFVLDREGLQPIGPTESSPLLVFRVISELAAEGHVISVQFELPIGKSMSPMLSHSLVHGEQLSIRSRVVDLSTF